MLWHANSCSAHACSMESSFLLVLILNFDIVRTGPKYIQTLGTCITEFVNPLPYQYKLVVLSVHTLTQIAKKYTCK